MKSSLASACCTIVTLVLLAVSLRYLADFWLLAFFYSLQLHFALAAMIGSLVGIGLGARRWGGLLLLASITVTGHALWMQYEIQPPRGTVMAEATRLKVLSFNILGDNFRNGEAIRDMILGSGADVAFVMEAGPLAGHLDALAQTYPYRLGCGVLTAECDLMLLSRHPMRASEMRSMSDLRGDRFALAEIDVEGQPVSVAAMHLTKPYYDTYHSRELAAATAFLAGATKPLIVGGDFNSASSAPDMQRFMRRNALMASGLEPATWPIRAGRIGVPLDHIFASRDTRPVSLTRIEDNYGSNHFGLVAEIALPPRD